MCVARRDAHVGCHVVAAATPRSPRRVRTGRSFIAKAQPARAADSKRVGGVRCEAVRACHVRDAVRARQPPSVGVAVMSECSECADLCTGTPACGGMGKLVHSTKIKQLISTLRTERNDPRGELSCCNDARNACGDLLQCLHCCASTHKRSAVRAASTSGSPRSASPHP